MRNFGKMIKMMAVAVVLSALFCSCNVAGGSSYADSYEVSSRSQFGSDSMGNGSGTGSKGGINVVIPKFNISVETEGNRSEISCGETLQMLCTVNEGSLEIGMCDWYVNGIKAASGERFEFSQKGPGVYTVSCIAADSATNPLYADSIQLSITVR